MSVETGRGGYDVECLRRGVRPVPAGQTSPRRTSVASTAAQGSPLSSVGVGSRRSGICIRSRIDAPDRRRGCHRGDGRGAVRNVDEQIRPAQRDGPGSCITVAGNVFELREDGSCRSRRSRDQADRRRRDERPRKVHLPLRSKPPRREVCGRARGTPALSYTDAQPGGPAHRAPSVRLSGATVFQLCDHRRVYPFDRPQDAKNGRKGLIVGVRVHIPFREGALV